jgi:hypothetical protein
MTGLQNKTILIISPQSWGKMFVSKHHYAIELARQGNSVYFLNPPLGKEAPRSKRISIEPSGIQAGLFLINHRLNFAYNIKFHFIGLFHALMRPHIRKILRAIGKPIDLVWSFDLGDLYPFRLFPAEAIKVFHPVDEPLNQTAINAARGAGIIFSVTREILDKYRQLPVERHFINHGLAETFLQPVDINKSAGVPIRVGISGNFLRTDIDRVILMQIVTGNPDILFDCWGAYAIDQSNIGGSMDKPTEAFINLLRSQPNAVLHGAIPANELALAIRHVDAFLICYDVNKDQSKGTNYHKIMEYLSTGKVIISNNVTTYRDQPELMQMVKERDNNKKLPELFGKVIGDLAHYNAPSLQQQRIDFSRNNSYLKQVQRIESIIISR